MRELVQDWVIEAEGLTKRFGPHEAVCGVSLRVRQGEIYALVGPDGAGKTTTLRLLAGVIAPTSGRARVAGFDVITEADRVKGQIGYMPQRFSLYEDLTVEENLSFFADLYGVSARVRQERQERLLAIARLEPFRQRLAGNLSGGMKQKLALICTLIHEPKVLLLDEPTTGVDPISRRDFWLLLHGLLVGGITVVYSTPYMDEAERCSTVAFLSQGRIIACDTPAALKANMDLAMLELEAFPIRTARQVAVEVDGVEIVQLFGERLHLAVTDAERVATELGVRLSEAGVRVGRLRKVSPSLEDVFMRLRENGGQENVDRENSKV